MPIAVNIPGQVGQIRLPVSNALLPLFETVINSIQSLEDSDAPEKEIVITALRAESSFSPGSEQAESGERNFHFCSFLVEDTGPGFNKVNYASFTETYTQLKRQKGCKGIGRFLWLKAFDDVQIESTYFEADQWMKRSFLFSMNGIEPEENTVVLDCAPACRRTTIRLNNVKSSYREFLPCSLECLARKIVDHCLPYFISGTCPQIILKEGQEKSRNLNQYYEKIYKAPFQQDSFELQGRIYTLYHTLLSSREQGQHELHLCANSREVRAYQLTNTIRDLKKKLTRNDLPCFYAGYLISDYLDERVNAGRSSFDFSDGASKDDIIGAASQYIRKYLKDDLEQVAAEKKAQIDQLVMARKPQYRLLLNRHPEVYDQIPPDLSEPALDQELYRHQQKWEAEVAKRKSEIEEKMKQDATSEPDFQKLFDSYCESITDLSRASLAEYVIHRKAVVDLLEQALGLDENGTFSRESRIHSILCPMQTTSDDIPYDSMNLWLIDDRLAYHHFLASDKQMNSIPLLQNSSADRMDLAVFDAALSFTADPDNITSITIVELKRPMRNDKNNNPVWQALKYVRALKEGKIKRLNGRSFNDLSHVSFYCYVIADLTPSVRDYADGANLTLTQDKQGYYGYNASFGAYIEIISYDKVLKNAKQRNQALFDKLFEPKLSELRHPELLDPQ